MGYCGVRLTQSGTAAKDHVVKYPKGEAHVRRRYIKFGRRHGVRRLLYTEPGPVVR